MEKQIIKKIVANILYLDDENEIQDNLSLFTSYDLSSIDFIDLCFELSQTSNKNFQPDQLWPFNTMMTNPDFYENEKWTKDGWINVCNILEFNGNNHQLGIKELYQYFTVNYISKRLEAL